eukprot:CAMPEP_0184856196 /NCGR_PEP_ID=MMETSP0580-20130426/1354_1 /TAXON_ID=1118495 /ORGANISM="Dactyliosolen fragilissimus" /LENGTH=358 /DNA_ID=CAMNT_0027351049 /DNA_START=34 /DNA_END=1107 /DNA_ORIENTATION=-
MSDYVGLKKVCKTREETMESLSAICDSKRASLSNVFGSGQLLVSDAPLSPKNETRHPEAERINTKSKSGVILGIDEAGRGPVLGPMTYAAAYWYPHDQNHIPTGLTDSKQLSANTRSSLFEKIGKCSYIGFVLRLLHASEISRNMLRKETYNLNAMSHDAAIEMIHAVLDQGVKIDTCYIDTVGVAESYQRKLEEVFATSGIKFVVEKKADAKYAPCSAASVVAKVSRDAIIKSWKWSEPNYNIEGDTEFGSGYPSDPKCKEWLDKNLVDPVFCFPDLVRFSWAPAKKAILEKGVKVTFEADEVDESEKDEDGKQSNLSSFIILKENASQKQKCQSKRGDFPEISVKKPRLEFFEKSK